VLNLYSRTRPFEESDEQVSDKFASQASVVVANARAFTKAQDLIEQLREALKSRDLIGQAKGIIEAREHCEPDEAFERLRSMSEHQRLEMRDLAQARHQDTGRVLSPDRLKGHERIPVDHTG
jgi:GAF domain-containing protein